jgi:hypothetical protein
MMMVYTLVNVPYASLMGGASGRTLAPLIFEHYGRYWQHDRQITGDRPELIRIPLSEFTASDTAGSIRPDKIEEISFYILNVNGDPGEGTVYPDEINFVIPANETYVEEQDIDNTPIHFFVAQNYPNPFNNSTTISSILRSPARVTVEIFDTTGTVVEKLLSDKRQPAGILQIRWQNNRLSSGLYFTGSGPVPIRL